MTAHTQRHQDWHARWLSVMRRYLIAATAAHLVWEIAQLPLYTIWDHGQPREIAFAVAHCTAGDVLILASTLVLALLLVGAGWPGDDRVYRRVATLAILFAAGYTIFSEWLNTTVRRSWAYSELMPTLPPLETGLSPLLQWIVVPVFAFWWARRARAGLTSY